MGYRQASCGLMAATTMMTAVVIPVVIVSSGRPMSVTATARCADEDDRTQARDRAARAAPRHVVRPVDRATMRRLLHNVH